VDSAPEAVKLAEALDAKFPDPTNKLAEADSEALQELDK